MEGHNSTQTPLAPQQVLTAQPKPVGHWLLDVQGRITSHKGRSPLAHTPSPFGPVKQRHGKPGPHAENDPQTAGDEQLPQLSSAQQSQRAVCAFS
ncbi:MAG TPA: hypothetical protein VFD48_16825 [Pyrinomonadaceae bacterium]|nr:hypothetical protein [Pyrinomonadaceae bacterium]